ncbi:MAG: 16S rRNA (cytidine(1402)-2'-O)-methyltransferase [Candidatus Omnitrophica bacterium]|nr:16S rRNA (cytidine(1402)-2'-O)-methyltransferase [Candidatus Omnitrophota bacterium]
MVGTLYLVATPIGNLGDFTYRAVETLKNVDLIACEDTRHSKILLARYGIDKPLTGFFDFSEKEKAPRIIEKVKNGAKVALISDAGTPGISDPGYRLVAEAIRVGARMEAIPGPTALVAALVLSGLPTDRFVFEGFFPVKAGQKKARLLSLKDEPRTVIFYESPHRLLKTLEAIRETLGDLEIVVARELTKKFEEVVRKRVSEAITHFSHKKVLGEFVILWNLMNPGGSSPNEPPGFIRRLR